MATDKPLPFAYQFTAGAFPRMMIDIFGEGICGGRRLTDIVAMQAR